MLHKDLNTLAAWSKNWLLKILKLANVAMENACMAMHFGLIYSVKLMLFI